MNANANTAPTRVALAGFGAIGGAIADALFTGIDGFVLTALAARDKAGARQRLGPRWRDVAVTDIEALEPLADLVVECSPAALLPAIATPFLAASKTVVVLSAGALLSHADLIELARREGGRIVIPSGAILGLDAMIAAAEGRIHKVTMTTRKPVAGLLGAPFLVEHNIDISQITEPVRIFSGSAREAAVGFPANLNVAVALSFAGIGPDRTMLEIWADPALRRNTHTVEVDADSARFTMTIENVPSENPKTGRITALSVIALLRKMHAPLSVGT